MAESWRSGSSRKKVLGLIRPGTTVCVFDTETTGIRPDAKIIQFSAMTLKVRDDYSLAPVSMMDQYINPGERLPEKIIEITGITDDKLKDYADESYYYDSIIQYLEQADVWAAYNSPFDLRMLKQMADRLMLPFFPKETVDVLVMCRDAAPGEKSHKLCDMLKLFFPGKEFQFHSAVEDVKATALCMQQCLRFYLGCQPKENAAPVHVEWASFWVNPRRGSQKRIKVCMDKDKETYGFIFWDVIAHHWSHMSNTKAKRLFEQSDLEEVERQVLQRYGGQYGADTMDDLAREMEKAKKKRSA